MEYRASLNLPRTSFPMRANASRREPEQLARWETDDLYESMLALRKDAPVFVLHDGPPYANGNMHMGHVLNRVLKDVIVKYKHLAGFRTPYVPGWDCHGLPIELQVEKKIGRKKKAEMSTVDVRKLCDEFARKFVDIQRTEVRRLGVVGDWDNPYLTLAPDYEAQEIRELGRLATGGSLYRKKKPVYWCSSCATALAEAEVEYEDKRSSSIYVRFPAVDVARLAEAADAGAEALAAHDPKRVSLVAWTTTPWTLPANMALSLNPDFDYVGLRVGDEILVVAEGLADAFLAAAGLTESGERLRLSASRLEGATLHHPWIDRQVPVVLGDHVTLESGTGIVHTAPGHGHEDYIVGTRYGLDVYCPVDGYGRFTDEVPEFAGQRVFDADPAVIETLAKAGTLVAQSSLDHSYPHCWRCKKALIYRATEQWFVSMEVGDLRKNALEAIDAVQWVPPWGRERIYGMIEGRPDWCISRQRVWGVPITAFFCEKCDEVHFDDTLAAHVAAIVEKEGSNAWFARPAAELLPDGYKCKCGSDSFTKEKDILDVWFDSGVSHAAVLERREGLRSPADLYLEGSDQHRGWFHTSLLTSVANRGAAPYKACLTHGFILDGKGHKMSKSGGNAMAPDQILKELGADVLRLWAAAEDYRNDVRMSKEIISQLVESYRRLRNTSRFLLGNLGDFDPSKHVVAPADMPELERWALGRLARVETRAKEAYDAYEFHSVYHLLNNYCAVDLSALYLDVVKDRCYCGGTDDLGRRASQTVMWHIVRALAGLSAPILSFLAEDVWAATPHLPEEPESIFLVDFPAPEVDWADETLAQRFDTMLQVRSAVTKAIEEERKEGRIGHSLEAHVHLDADGDLGRLLHAEEEFLPEFFIASRVSFGGMECPASTLEGLRVGIARVSGEKCDRCWMYFEELGAEPEYPGTCARCAEVLVQSGFKEEA
ncbi:MAG: isoleucine--tRNA ligase [Candidatus Binatia bacterium]|nr:isoleucine--tRNA ligase [Candidatus Binatia bacterium]